MIKVNIFFIFLNNFYFSFFKNIFLKSFYYRLRSRKNLSTRFNTFSAFKIDPLAVEKIYSYIGKLVNLLFEGIT